MPSNSAGQIGLDLKINGKDYKKQIKQYGDYGSSQLQGSFSNTFKNIGKMAMGAFAIAGISKFTASCLKLGSDLTEVQNVVDVSFPNMTSQVDAFAKSAISNFGMSELAAKKFMGSFGAMSRAYGFNEKKASEMSETLTGLVGDVSSFYNIDQEDAYAKLSAVFTSETEALKHLGVVMTQNALDEYALANGYGKTTAKMTEQEKVALRYAFVQKQLSLATGDFIRTQDGWANQTRVLSLRFDQLKASLGKGFIALFTPIVKGINWVLSNLQPLADSFASMIEMLTGTPASSGGGALADTSSDISSATEGAEGLSDGLSDAGKSGEKTAKKINKAFAKIDTINKLTFGSDEGDSGSEGSGGGTGATGGSVADAVDFPKAGEQGNKFSGILDGIINEFKRLSELFVKGFELGFGNSFKNIDKIKTYILSIGESISNIFTDPKVLSAGRDWLDSLYEYWGITVGSFASIGISIATLVTGSIARYLEQNAGFIKNQLVQLFNIGERTNEILGSFWLLLADIANVFAGGTATQIGANLIQGIANGIIGGFVLFKRIAVDILNCIIDPLVSNKDKIVSTIEGMLKPIEEVTGTISKGITDTFKTINDTYNKYVAPAFSRIASGLSSVLGTILDAYNTYIAPVINSIATEFTSMWSNHIQPAINSIVEFFGKFAELFIILWEQSVGPLIEQLVGVLAPIVGAVFNGIWNVVSTVFNFIFGIIETLMTILGGLCEFLSGVFTGNWDKVWSGIYSIFEGVLTGIQSFLTLTFDSIMGFIDSSLGFIIAIWESVWNNISSFFGDTWKGIDEGIKGAINNVKTTIENVLKTIKGIWEGMWSGLKSFVSDTWNNILGIFSTGGKIFNGIVGAIGDVFKNIVNAIIDGVNTVIAIPFKTINGLLNEIRSFDILGQKPFKGMWGKNPLPVPQIPHLAQGGYVKANQPQLAMIGDNKRYGEVVAPENKMIDMINTALAMQKEKGSVNGLDVLINLIKELITTVKNLSLKVDIDMKKMSILLENAKKERQMIGG